MKKKIAVMVLVLILLGPLGAFGNASFENSLEEARRGDVSAMCDVAVAYYTGQGTLKDPFKAKCWAKKAYDNGSKRAEKIWNEFELWLFSGSCQGFIDDTPLSGSKSGASYIEPVTGIRFRYVPKGCFIMGCHKDAAKCSKDEKPGHRVCLDGFWMSESEVTQQQWVVVMGSNPSRFLNNPTLPVENVSFFEVQQFIQILNSRISDKTSLPSEAQWEYACRSAGKGDNFPWVEDLESPSANCGTCRPEVYTGQTLPVGSFTPNELGLFDLSGNVKEWCLDFYEKRAYEAHEKSNPVHDERSPARVVRGGSFADTIYRLRCTARDKMLPGMKSEFTGFRLILERKE